MKKLIGLLALLLTAPAHAETFSGGSFWCFAASYGAGTPKCETISTMLNLSLAQAKAYVEVNYGQPESEGADYVVTAKRITVDQCWVNVYLITQEYLGDNYIEYPETWQSSVYAWGLKTWQWVCKEPYPGAPPSCGQNPPQ